MTFAQRTAARMAGALAAGAVGAAATVAGLGTAAISALFGASLVGALSALERITEPGARRAGRAFAGGALVGAPAAALAFALGPWAGSFAQPAGAELVAAVTGIVAYAALGAAAGAAPGFFAFSGALSRGGLVGGLLGGAAGGALASLAPAWAAPLVGALAIGGAYVAFRRQHAAARLVALAPEPVPRMDITLRDHRVVVGTGPECDLRLDDSAIKSLRPLVLTYRDASYFVDDPSPKPGGIKVNGQPVTSHRLEHGDVIEVGRSRYRFEWLGERGPET